jgi:hypothetical protein
MLVPVRIAASYRWQGKERSRLGRKQSFEVHRLGNGRFAMGDGDHLWLSERFCAATLLNDLGVVAARSYRGLRSRSLLMRAATVRLPWGGGAAGSAAAASRGITSNAKAKRLDEAVGAPTSKMRHSRDQRHDRCQPSLANPGYSAEGTHRVHSFLYYAFFDQG